MCTNYNYIHYWRRLEQKSQVYITSNLRCTLQSVIKIYETTGIYLLHFVLLCFALFCKCKTLRTLALTLYSLVQKLLQVTGNGNVHGFPHLGE